MIVHYISTFTSMSPCANHFECRFTTLMSEDKENGHPSSCITERLNFMTQTIDMQKLQHMFSIQYLNSLTFFNMRLKSILKRYDRRDATTFATCCCTSLYPTLLVKWYNMRHLSIQFHHSVDPQIHRIVGSHPLCRNRDTKTYGVHVVAKQELYISRQAQIIGRMGTHSSDLCRAYSTSRVNAKSSEAPFHSSVTRDICKIRHKNTTKNSTDSHQSCLNTMIPTAISYTGHDIMNCIP